ncbi:MAG: SRPBCC family protein, partial [Planctomycetota bacterium]
MPAYSVTRQICIDVPPEKAIEVVSDFATWQTWSPWLQADPEANVTVSQDSDSVGSTYEWSGGVCGAGKLTHESIERHSTWSKLEFFKPMKSVCGTGFEAIANAKGGCDLTWKMEGKLPFFLFFMKSMIETFVGMDYERGLAMIKSYCESGEVPSKIEFLGIQ